MIKAEPYAILKEPLKPQLGPQLQEIMHRVLISAAHNCYSHNVECVMR
jgi:hypothetical protein